jgi:type II secretory pathway pseudopilin PulG
MESIIHLTLIALPLFTGPVAAFVSMSLIARDQYKALTALWVALGIIAIPYGIYIAYSFGDFFPGPGCLISVLIPITALTSFLVIRFRSKGGITDVPLRKRLTFAALAIIPITQCGAPVIGSGYARLCEDRNREAAKVIIEAVESYKKDSGEYPTLQNFQSNLDFLVPRYLKSIPARPCALPNTPSPDSYLNLGDDWSLHYCGNSNKHLLLLVPIIGSDTQQTYDFITARWSMANALDGYCR